MCGGATGDVMRCSVVILPEQPWREARHIWRRAEELGFDHAFTYDHLAWRSLRDSPWFSAMPILAAAAMVTERIRLGPLVASPNFRHPVSLSREIVTLDELSAGRFTLGIGSGGEGWDATILGQEPWSRSERTARFVEFVDLTDAVLRDPATSFQGTYYAADEARSYPGCVQRPRVPFAVAATGPRAMAVVARHGDTWVTTGGSTPIPAQVAMLEEACAQIGRDATTLRRLLLSGPELDPGLGSPAQFDDTAGRYEAMGITDFAVHWPRQTEPYRADLATFERIFSR